jgi:hypothetical protein
MCVNASAEPDSTGWGVGLEAPGASSCPSGPIVTGQSWGAPFARAWQSQVGHGEQAAGVGIHDDGGAGFGLAGDDGLAESLLSLVLERLVDAEDEVLAELGRLVSDGPAR